MNARKKQDHERVIDQIKKVSAEMQNPTENSFHILMEASAFIQRELTQPTFTEAKAFPDIDNKYLSAMERAAAFNLKTMFSHPEKYTRASAKELSITTDPFSLIGKFMKTSFVPKKDLNEDAKDHWQKIFAADIKQKAAGLTKQMKSLTGREIGRGIGKTSGYIGVLVIMIGTLLMSYLICMIGLGLIVVDATLNTVLKEAIDPTDEVVSDAKNYPYVLSGSFPLVHVNRTEEYLDRVVDPGENFYANNLLELIKAIVRYENLVITSEPKLGVDHSKFPFDTLEYFQKRDITFGMTPEFIFDFKSRIMDASNMCLSNDLTMPMEKQGAWTHAFMLSIKSFCTTMNHQQTQQFTDIGTLVSMYETLCLQIWDAFLRDNKVVETVKIENQYLDVNVSDDTHDIVQMYNMAQLHPTRISTDASQLAKSILESVGGNVNIITEATINNQQDTSKQIADISARFGKALATSKQAADQISQRALPWCTQNAQKLKEVENNFTSQDSATLKNYSYDVKSIQSATVFLTKLNSFLTSEYPSKRTTSPVGNINTLLKSSFPNLQMSDDKSYPANQITNMIMSGNPETEAKEITITGQQLKSKYDQMVDLLTSQDTKSYFASKVFTDFQNTAKTFQTIVNNAAKNPAPKTESVMMEADEINSPPTINNQQNNTPSQQNDQMNTTQTQQQKAEPKKETTQANTNNANDAHVFEHAANIVVSVMTGVQSMVNEAYNLVTQYYTDLSGRNQQNTMQNQ